jgi:hypothetical protein
MMMMMMMMMIRVMMMMMIISFLSHLLFRFIWGREFY